MIRKIIKYPNETLNLASKDVEVFDDKLHVLLNDMRDTMLDKKGVGISAIQIGVPLNVVVIDYEGKLIEAVNPRIISSNGEQSLIEGCLSIPGVRAVVERALEVEVLYSDRHPSYNLAARDRASKRWPILR